MFMMILLGNVMRPNKKKIDSKNEQTNLITGLKNENRFYEKLIA